MIMTVIEHRDPQDTLDESETVVAELTDGMKLIKTPDEGIVRMPEDHGRQDRVYDCWKDATLFFGLWATTGGWTDPYPTSGTSMVPVEVVAAGKDAAAAYLLVGTGTTSTRGAVARMLNISEQTVSNYANRVRWSE